MVLSVPNHGNAVEAGLWRCGRCLSGKDAASVVAVRKDPSPRFAESAEQNGEKFPRMRTSRIEPLNLSSPQGRSADSLVCCIADWQSAATLLARPDTPGVGRFIAQCLVFLWSLVLGIWSFNVGGFMGRELRTVSGCARPSPVRKSALSFAGKFMLILVPL